MEELPSKKCVIDRGLDFFAGSGEIEGARAASSGALHDMEIDHGRLDRCVAHEGLDGADVGSGLK
jgi:16S rRNA G966 N2-methylase RsmD